MVLQLKIQIKGITKPPVWRRVLVPAQFTFDRLHEVIQAAFGWGNYHLYQFSPKGFGSHPQIGIADEEWAEEHVEHAENTVVGDFLNKKGQKFTYIYDFGDDWVHQITVEETLDATSVSAQLVAGKGTCPPEDCGGVWGYEELRKVLSNPKDPEYDSMREWVGLEGEEEWIADYFDLEDSKDDVSQC